MSDSIHRTLAQSYLAYFLFSILGLLADSVFGFAGKIPHATTVAVVCFGIGPALIVWAQYTSKALRNHNHDIAPLYFHYGPYRFLRNPTHLGIVVLVAGYAVISGSAIFLAVTLIGYIISNHLFRHYEIILKETFGSAYDQYKSKVPKIF